MKKALIFAAILALAALILSSCRMREATPATRETERAPVTEPATDEPTGTETSPAAPTESETEEPTESATEELTEPATEELTGTEAPTEAGTAAAVDTEDPYKYSPPPIGYDVNAHLASKRILIDAGHGFNDPGCTSDYLGGVYEVDITYGLATLLSAELEKRGYEPVMLRAADSYPSDGEIADAARSLGIFFREEKLNAFADYSAYDRTIWADVIHRRDPVAMMISIHVNAYPAAEYVNGTELYYCVENGCAAPTAQLVGQIESKLRSSFPDRRLKVEGTVWSDSFIVTKWTEMPSVLVETAYSTNEEDAKNLLDDDFREKYVDALADAIEAYMKAR